MSFASVGDVGAGVGGVGCFGVVDVIWSLLLVYDIEYLR